MKKFLIPVVFTLCAFVMTSAMVADGAITREGDAVVVDTKTIVKGVVGYNGSTHVKIYIKKDKIEKIVPQCYSLINIRRFCRWYYKYCRYIQW